jgi:hypothetical protein
MDDIRMKFPIVMFVGKLGSGKDTAAQFMRDRVVNGDSVTLAAPMKDFAKEVFGFSHQQMYGPSKLREEKFDYSLPEVREAYFRNRDWFLTKVLVGPNNFKVLDDWFDGIIEGGCYTGRHILQTLGTEAGRQISRDIWIDAGIRAATEKLVNGANLVTITDGRFRNEVLAVKKVGGMVVSIIDPDNKTVATHASEKEQESIPKFWYDYVITNNKADGLLTLKNIVNDIKL